MKKAKEIEFDASDLIAAVEGVRDHLKGKRKLTMRTTRVSLPARAPDISPDEIAAARKSLNVSQPVFARLLNVRTVTAASWEQGRRKPFGAALRLLQIARTHPETLLEA